MAAEREWIEDQVFPLAGAPSDVHEVVDDVEPRLTKATRRVDDRQQNAIR